VGAKGGVERTVTVTVTEDKLEKDPIVAELRAAGASLVLAIASAENGDWAAQRWPHRALPCRRRCPSVSEAT
jgi:hypothetical protein